MLEAQGSNPFDWTHDNELEVLRLGQLSYKIGSTVSGEVPATERAGLRFHNNRTIHHPIEGPRQPDHPPPGQQQPSPELVPPRDRPREP